MYILLKKQAEILKKIQVDKLERPSVIKLKLTSEDLMQPCNMKTVFVSASPVLVNEVSRFYSKLKDGIIAYLVAKEKSK